MRLRLSGFVLSLLLTTVALYGKLSSPTGAAVWVGQASATL